MEDKQVKRPRGRPKKEKIIKAPKIIGHPKNTKNTVDHWKVINKTDKTELLFRTKEEMAKYIKCSPSLIVQFYLKGKPIKHNFLDNFEIIKLELKK
jgi:hypothetical protein